MPLATAKRQVNVSPIRRGNIGTNVATMTGETLILAMRKSAGQTFPRSFGETLGNAGRVARPNVSPRVCLVETPADGGRTARCARLGGAR